MKIKIFILFILILFIAACSNPSESKFDPPADHTINNDGAKHKTGLNDPEKNCISCHGADLKGGNVGVSCYECHGKKW